nr:hypothetical protein [Actinomycetota bacterium]
MVMEMAESITTGPIATEPPASRALDLLDTGPAVEAVLAGQAQVHQAVQAAQAEIGRAVDLLTRAYLAGGRLLLLVLGRPAGSRSRKRSRCPVPTASRRTGSRRGWPVAGLRTWSVPTRPRTTWNW